MGTKKISCARNTAVVALIGLVLTGCFEDSSDTGSVQTVDWYKAHDDDRKMTLQACSNNPGELRDTPNCINALQAERALSSGEPFELNLPHSMGEENS
ncbi:EexN family lipoprotein [Kushneria konosiri]|uniref:EexN family lipoprotein n=1 Tax=Kushneria konosiri TaxID=698828 RepID=A0A2Z2HDL1_9GAMM|nr:EexN family lipoprotein [Kushneria konosiri]ARS53520.1 hypothetical protein B9G99_12180 [Kushneria konosiri]